MNTTNKKWIEAGFVDEPIAKNIDLKTEIRRMCQEKKAIIMAHYYTQGAIQEVADFVGDSLAPVSYTHLRAHETS